MIKKFSLSAINILGLALLLLSGVAVAQDDSPQASAPGSPSSYGVVTNPSGSVARRRPRKPRRQVAAKQRKTETAAPATYQDYLDRGDDLFEQGQYAEAAAAYQEALRLKPDDVEALYGLGDANAKSGNNTEMLQAYNRAKTIIAPVSGGVLTDKAISLPEPTYPEAARQARASGSVTVQVMVDENGNVIEARSVSGHPLLTAAAVKAALEAKFAPRLKDGRPVKVWGVLTLTFSLS